MKYNFKSATIHSSSPQRTDTLAPLVSEKQPITLFPCQNEPIIEAVVSNKANTVKEEIQILIEAEDTESANKK